MNITQALSDQYLVLKASAQEILQLDLKDETAVERLEQLQVIQKTARDQIEQMCANKGQSFVENGLQEVITDCIDLEMKIKYKLEEYQNILMDNIRELKKAEFARKKYYNNYSQAEGFFLDEHQ